MAGTVLFVLLCSSLCVATMVAASVCPGLNTSRFAPMGCQPPSTCCKLNNQAYKCAEDKGCNVCPECCHDVFAPADQCHRCVSKSCAYEELAQFGCSASGSHNCCPTAPLNASKTKKNCLLVGDSVTNGQSGLVATKLADVCQVQKLIGNDAAGEAGCWPISSSSPFGDRIEWDVIHFNEGLHSLYSRVNNSADLAVWAAQLADFTKLIQQSHPKASLIYATMTPYMPEKFDTRPQSARSDLENRNAVAVATVKRNGVRRINDLYKVVTDKCGMVYRNCSICDDESKYHPGVVCGDHYVAAGWDLLATSTADSIRAVL